MAPRPSFARIVAMASSTRAACLGQPLGTDSDQPKGGAVDLAVQQCQRCARQCIGELGRRG
jgi:hypothetical protein